MKWAFWNAMMYISLFATLSAAHKENYFWWTIFMGLIIISIIQMWKHEK